MISLEQIFIFTLVFLRISALLIMIPVIGERTVPLRVKGGLAILLSLLVFPTAGVDMNSLQTGDEILALAIAMIGEVMIGIVIGLATKIIFAGIQFAGEMIGIQIGFSIVNVIDPVSSSQVSIIAEFQYLIALLIYLAVDAHHTLIFAIVDSYRIVSPFSYYFSGSLVKHIIMLSKELFVLAIKISAPIMAVLLFTNVALGVVARTVPQINVFIVGFPVQIAVGLIVFGLTAPVFVYIVQRVLSSLNVEVYTLLRFM
ncbi:MAG: flagellar type III secretion system protein FliR [Deltaproteobacteria bacterium]|nr:flagellar type III secretion system protein FliR [Deltaproteobacteria bacterium]